MHFRNRCDQPSSGAVSSRAAHTATSRPIVTKAEQRDVGVVASILVGDQRNAAGAANHQRRRRRSIVRARTERFIRSMVAGMCAMLPISVALENAARVVFAAQTSHGPRRTVESSEFSTDGASAGIRLRTVISRLENP